MGENLGTSIAVSRGMLEGGSGQPAATRDHCLRFDHERPNGVLVAVRLAKERNATGWERESTTLIGEPPRFVKVRISVRQSTAVALLATATFFLPYREGYAIRPFVTDDARVVGRRLAQLETWLVGSRDEFVHNALGAVGPTDWLEITTGFSHGVTHTGADKGYSITGPLFQLKVLAKEAKPAALPGVAFAMGVIPPFGHGALTPEGPGAFGYTAVTQSLLNDDLLLHANIGVTAADEKTAGVVTTTGGFGFQAHVIAGLKAVAEAYYGDPYDPLLAAAATQAGFRYVVNDNFQFDGTFGSTISGNSEQWWTLGIRLVSDPLW